MSDDKVFIQGRNRDTALAILAAAGELGYPLDVVRTTLNGYYAPAAVVKKYEAGVEYTPAKEAAPEPAAEATEAVEAEVVEAEAEVEQPSKKASTEAWVAYAETKGYDPARGLTRKELIDEYGQS